MQQYLTTRNIIIAVVLVVLLALAVKCQSPGVESSLTAGASYGYTDQVTDTHAAGLFLNATKSVTLGKPVTLAGDLSLETNPQFRTSESANVRLSGEARVHLRENFFVAPGFTYGKDFVSGRNITTQIPTLKVGLMPTEKTTIYYTHLFADRSVLFRDNRVDFRNATQGHRIGLDQFFNLSKNYHRKAYLGMSYTTSRINVTNIRFPQNGDTLLVRFGISFWN